MPTEIQSYEDFGTFILAKRLTLTLRIRCIILVIFSSIPRMLVAAKVISNLSNRSQ